MAITARQLDTTAVEEQFLEIVRELLTELGSRQALNHVSLNSSFERDLGLGSLERVELLVRSEARFDTRLPDTVAQQAETPGEWVRALLASGGTAVGASPVALPERRPHRARIAIKQPSREAPSAAADATNWLQVLERHAEAEPDRVHIHLLSEDSVEDISYGEVLRAASEVAAGLAEKGLRRNEAVAIMLPTGADFFFAFFGVMLAGGIAVPIYPPARPDQLEEYVRRQVLILRNAEVRFLISFEKARTISKILRVRLPSLVETTSVGSLRQAGTAGGSPSRLAGAHQPSDIAFIQYTSGSTGDPKGVVLSQANVLANVRGIGWAVKFRPADVVVSWLPLYHDMGLIGSWLFSVYFGAPITVLSPLAFLSRPERWLWALHDSGGTLCPAPNFAYELCARKIPERALDGLDLSAWRIAINAGEAVLPETLERFEMRFAPYGFRAQSFVPCYGLAESSVALTFPPIERRPIIDAIGRDAFEAEGRAEPASRANTASAESGALRFVANGAPLPGHEIKLVDGAGREVGDRIQARILFRGPSRTDGYYRNPQATAAVIDNQGWMDSGDLGYRADGELFVTGRSKDIIIKAGHNILPQEIEAAAGEAAGVRRGCVAAFGSPDASSGTERLVVVAETRAAGREERRRLEVDVMRRVHAAVGTPPDKVVLVPPQSIPKTSSGKIRRSETRRLYESGRLVSAKRPPWMQLFRLWAGNAGSWLALRSGQWGERIHGAYTAALVSGAVGTTRLLVRLLPGQQAAASVIRGGARTLLFLSGQHVAFEDHRAPTGARVERTGSAVGAVFMANRAGLFDPLGLAAVVSQPFFFASASALAGLPPKVAAMLRPLLAPPIEDTAAPPGGTERQRILRALQTGHSIMALADSPMGAPPELSRFRLDAIHAAVSTGAAIYPVAVRGTARFLGRSADGPTEMRIVVGESIRPETEDQRELVTMREAVRNALAEMCRSVEAED